MTKKDSPINVDNTQELTLEELCQALSITPDFIHELVDYGILEPGHYSFTTIHIHRVRTVIHLQNDLEVNLPGAALALDLMAELEDLRARIAWLEKQ